MIKTYYKLAKPGIVMGNAITIVGGFALASKGHFNYPLFFATLIGLSLIIGSACIFNNYIDRIRDQKMERTKNRALVTGSISIRNALIYASILGSFGFFLLGYYTNLLTLTIASIGFFVYVILYSNWKAKTVYGTAIGSIAGSVPLVVGYCAVTNRLDVGALILFMIMVFWQMPHFFAIAMYRIDEYAAASIPVLPIVKGAKYTKIRMILYIIAFTLAVSMLSFQGYTSPTFLYVAAILGLSWLYLAIKGFKAKNDKQWARQMFRVSLLVITTLCLMITI